MYEYRVKSVERVVDGDTVDVILDLGFGLFKKERVRVAGVDTPEKRTRNDKEKMLGYDATNFAEEWFAAEGDIVVRTSKDGKYGRMLGHFYREDECFNELVVTKGYGFEYWGEAKRNMDNMDTLMALLNIRGYETWEDYAESKE